MDDPLATALMLIAVAVLAVTVLVWIRPLLRSPAPVSEAGPGSAPDPRRSAAPQTSTSPTGPLAKGFGYLFSPLGLPRRQTSIGSRLERALRRIDSVDPYATHRRVGLALLQTTETDPPETRPREIPR